MASELERGPEARALAQRVLLTIVHALGSSSDRLIVLGGLVPPMLAAGLKYDVPSHLGTTDVDLLLSVHIGRLDGSYQSLEETLRRIKLEPTEEDHWRWLARIDGYRIKVEFLCDLDDRPEGAFILADGCSMLGAVNLRGTRYVAEDYVVEWLEGELMDRSGSVRVQFRRAGLAGYVVAKAHAIMGRALQKDYYDFAYVLLYNSAGGPEAAAEATRNAPFYAEVMRKTRLWREVEDRFANIGRVGPQDFARESLEADPTADESRLKEDAVSAAEAFFRVLHRGEPS